jgi:manganese/zinc/iron transport system permease protein
MIYWLAVATDEWHQALWTIGLGVLGNVTCALLGCFLVLRRMSLLGDAISHGILPGLVIGYLLGHSLTGWGIYLGAVMFGFLTAFLTQWLHSVTQVPEDSSMGIVFTSMFAIGVILLSGVVTHVDLDPSCVFFGLLETLPLDTTWPGVELPRAFWPMALALLLTVGFILLFWKELKITSFDPDQATAMGLKAGVIHYLLMAMVAGVTVSSFSAMGSILVIVMLIVPGACGQMLSDRLAGMLGWSAAVAALSAFLACLLAPEHANLPGMMAVVAGGQFFLVILFAPRHGIVARLVRHTRLALRIAREDILAGLYRREEARQESIVPVRGTLARLAAWELCHRGQVRRSSAGGFLLTEAGRRRAQLVIRAHRLWEAFLEKNFELPPDHLHEPAAQMEHYIGPDFQEVLATYLQQPRLDPHGRPIPPT